MLYYLTIAYVTSNNFKLETALSYPLLSFWIFYHFEIDKDQLNTLD